MIEEILQKYVPKNSKLVLAFSGGPDSVYLLEKIRKLPYKIILAHFNHNLRGKESNADEKFCLQIAKKYNLEIEIGSAHFSKFSEDLARKKRYEFLHTIKNKHKAKFILTGHHLDDNLETFLLNFIRGAGIKGLKGMKISNNDILRPLLHIGKEEILNYLKKKGIKYRVDSSNKDTKYKRNAVRLNVIPALNKIQPDLLKIFKRNMENINEIYEFIDIKTKKWIKKNYINNRLPIKEFKNLDLALQKNILQKIYIEIYGDSKGISSDLINRIMTLINNKKTGKQVPFGKDFRACIISKYTEFTAKNTFKTISKKTLKINGKTKFKYGEIETKILNKIPENLTNAIYLDFEKLHTPLYIRSKINGDRFNPYGLKGSKKIQDFYVDKKIPEFLRNAIPVYIDKKGKIAAINSNSIDDKFKITKNTKKILKITVKYLEKRLKKCKL